MEPSSSILSLSGSSRRPTAEGCIDEPRSNKLCMRLLLLEAGGLEKEWRGEEKDARPERIGEEAEGLDVEEEEEEEEEVLLEEEEEEGEGEVARPSPRRLDR